MENNDNDGEVSKLRVQDEQTSMSDMQHEIRAIARQNREGETTIHMQGTVTEWITSDVAFARIDRGKIRDNQIAIELGFDGDYPDE
jgi:hypothetical protein